MNVLLLVGALSALALAIYRIPTTMPKPQTTFLPHPSLTVVLVLASAVLMAFYLSAVNFLSLDYKAAFLVVMLTYGAVFTVAARLSRIPLLTRSTDRSKK